MVALEAAHRVVLESTHVIVLLVEILLLLPLLEILGSRHLREGWLIEWGNGLVVRVWRVVRLGLRGLGWLGRVELRAGHLSLLNFIEELLPS